MGTNARIDPHNQFVNPASKMALARALYWQGWRVCKIAEHLGESAEAIRKWKTREGWETVNYRERISQTIEARIVLLTNKDNKDGKDFKELDLLMRQMERLARIEKYSQPGGNERDLNPNVERGIRKKREKRNVIDESGIAAIEAAFLDGLFDYQRLWHTAGQSHRIRNILKSRQIGATYYFAREAIADAARTGKNKIFLSASKAQASIFRTYIVKMVQEACDIGLVGDPIILGNGAELHFLGTNSKTAQGYHGDTYLDEYFWVQRFLEFRKVTSGMAMHKQWRQTYISTPSTMTHEAYSFWSGGEWNRRRQRTERKDFKTDHKTLQNGLLCPDGQWRQIVTVEDAIAGGCNLFDLAQLRLEYSPDEFANLLMCEFMDDTLSAFPLEALQLCMVDSWEIWDDVKPFAPRPVGNAPVWIGYDPAGDGDDGDGAGLVVDLPPASPGGPHRLLERHKIQGEDYDSQGRFVLSFLERYNVQHIGVDTTGIGDAVGKVIASRFPQMTRYQYHPVLKTNMVLQGQQMVLKGRLKFDAGWTDLISALMAIRRTMTPAGGASTYSAGRNRRTGHAELGWATLHALHHEPLEVFDGSTRSVLEIY